MQRLESACSAKRSRMGADSESTLNAGLDGEPVYCSDCEAPIVLYTVSQVGYRLVCGCDGVSVNIDAVASESNLFDPITGKWSGLDDIRVKTDYE